MPEKELHRMRLLIIWLLFAFADGHNFEWELCNLYYNRTYCDAQETVEQRQHPSSPPTSLANGALSKKINEASIFTKTTIQPTFEIVSSTQQLQTAVNPRLFGSGLTSTDVAALDSSVPSAERHRLTHTGPVSTDPAAVAAARSDFGTFANRLGQGSKEVSKIQSEIPLEFMVPQDIPSSRFQAQQIFGMSIPMSSIKGYSSSDSNIDPLKIPSVALPEMPRLLGESEVTGQINMSPSQEVVMDAKPKEEAAIKKIEKAELAKLENETTPADSSAMNRQFVRYTVNQDPFDVEKGKPLLEYFNTSLLTSPVPNNQDPVKLGVSPSNIADAEKLKQQQSSSVNSNLVNKPQPASTRSKWRPISQGPLNLTPLSMGPVGFLKNKRIFTKPAPPPPPKTPQLPPDHRECPVMKPEYDRICFVRPEPHAFSTTDNFCKAFRRNCQNLIKSSGGLIDPEARIKAHQPEQNVKPQIAFTETNMTESCFQLKPEYDDNCLTEPSLNNAQEIIAFCGAYLTMCSDVMDLPEWKKKPDYSTYCSMNLERFEFVCPQPFRFGKYTEQATKFCERYMRRCPENQVPNKPVYFKKEKHIYVREVEYICTGLKNFVSTYCIRPTVLKIMKYLTICGFYKQKCIDVYTSVIYA